MPETFVINDVLTKMFLPPKWTGISISGGTGTMGLACYEFGASYFYVDKNEQMGMIAIQRLKEHVYASEIKKEREETKESIPTQKSITEGIDLDQEGNCISCGTRTK